MTTKGLGLGYHKKVKPLSATKINGNAFWPLPPGPFHVTTKTGV